MPSIKKPRLHKNINLWYLNTFFSYSAFILPIWVIFNTEYLGLNNTQAYLLGVLSYGLSAVFEIPTGAWSDRYGRAKIYKIGTVFYMLSVASFLVFKNFYVLLLLQILGALGLAMKSGGIEALVHDSLPEKNRQELYASVNGKRMSLLFISRVVTVLFSGLFYSYDPRLPILASTLMSFVGLAISFLFVEIRLEAATALSNFSHMKETIFFMLKKKALVIFTVLIMIHSFISEALFSFYQPYLRHIGVEIQNFGIYYAIVSALSAIGALAVIKVLKKTNAFYVVFGLLLAASFNIVLFLVENQYTALVALIPSGLAFGFIQVTKKTYIQRHVGSKHQATALSVASFAQTLSFFLAVLLMGISLDFLSIFETNIVLSGLAILSLPITLYGIRLARRS